MRSIVVTLVVLAGLAVAASGQSIYPVQQERSLDVWAKTRDSDGVRDSAAAPDMEPWLAYVNASDVSPSDGGNMSTTADQLSAIDGALLSAYGMVGMHTDDSGSYLYGTAHARYMVRFAVAAPTALQMSGAIAAAIGYGNWDGGLLTAEASVRIRKIAGPVVVEQAVYVEHDFAFPGMEASVPLDFVSELQPGVYELEVVAHVDASNLRNFGGSWLLAEVSYIVDVEFLPVEGPVDCEAADIDADTDVDVLDFYQLQQCFDGPR